MTMRTYVFIVLTLFALPTLGQNSSTAEKRIRKLVSGLPEVKAMDGRYDSVSRRVQQTVIQISAPQFEVPEGRQVLYKAEVGYQGSGRFEPHLYLYIDTSNSQIYIEDLNHGDRPTIEEWRSRREDNRIPENSLQPVLDAAEAKPENQPEILDKNES